MEQIARTGVLTAGTSKDAFPYAYKNKQGDLVGYSIDMMQRISQELALELGRPVRLKLKALDTDERIPMLASSKVSLVCDASSFTWERDRKVDFSVSYGITGTQLLVPSDSSLSSPESLLGKRVGVLPRTTSEIAIRKHQPEAIMVLMEDRDSGYQALRAGEIDAFADDGVLLYSWLARQPKPALFKVAADAYSKEDIACMLPQDDSAFQRIVDIALIRYMQGFLDRQTKETAIFDQWFGPNSAAPLTVDLRELSIETMQLMVDLKEEAPATGKASQ
ncbi:amino acid ABC transporter substrate-binding protein [Synechococcus sp. CS-603]|uniref:amino acid ABC transporter substrate-binding protein n=1 Tax=Synechococcus sp. CS-603 TaxID=2847981 RepID=UPI00223C0FC1|nr:amino acid ABC transporter substrate-binding protein [Synechococcus sp. CS-603]MCT0203467.1 amino acid ABC transporter substrate-binding protein [Synechococcus sp. CS-603]